MVECRGSIRQGSSVVEQDLHKVEVTGSTPVPATRL